MDMPTALILRDRVFVRLTTRRMTAWWCKYVERYGRRSIARRRQIRDETRRRAGRMSRRLRVAIERIALAQRAPAVRPPGLYHVVVVVVVVGGLCGRRTDVISANISASDRSQGAEDSANSRRILAPCRGATRRRIPRGRCAHKVGA